MARGSDALGPGRSDAIVAARGFPRRRQLEGPPLHALTAYRPNRLAAGQRVDLKLLIASLRCTTPVRGLLTSSVPNRCYERTVSRPLPSAIEPPSPSGGRAPAAQAGRWAHGPE